MAHHLVSDTLPTNALRIRSGRKQFIRLLEATRQKRDCTGHHHENLRVFEVTLAERGGFVLEPREVTSRRGAPHLPSRLPLSQSTGSSPEPDERQLFSYRENPGERDFNPCLVTQTRRELELGALGAQQTPMLRRAVLSKSTLTNEECPMSKENLVMMELLEKRAVKREERRNFFRKSAGFLAGAAATGTLLAGCGNDSNAGATPVNGSAQQDLDVLNFALNLEYLEANFYLFATTGSGIPSAMQTGTGTQGAVTGGAMVDFMGDTLTQQYANEIAGDEIAHVTFLRTTLGSSAVAQPAINISGTDPNGAFSKAAQAAGLVAAGTAFNPYADPVSFLYGAFIFEDVGVTAYKGASPLISNPTYLEAAAGILAVEAYHAGLVRTVLYGKGLATPSILTNVDAISNARDSLDGSTDDDQGISPSQGQHPGSGATTQSNIVPTDANGIAYSRTAGQVLNVVYLNKASVTSGGFFPAGLNGNLKTSTAEP
jgi:hypothetical protein